MKASTLNAANGHDMALAAIITAVQKPRQQSLGQRDLAQVVDGEQCLIHFQLSRVDFAPIRHSGVVDEDVDAAAESGGDGGSGGGNGRQVREVEARDLWGVPMNARELVSFRSCRKTVGHLVDIILMQP